MLPAFKVSCDVLFFDLLVPRYKSLHHGPCDKVCDRADTEHDHVAGLLALESQEGKCCSHAFRVVEQSSCAEVDDERADTSRHSSDTCDGSDG